MGRWIVEEPVDLAALLRETEDPACGGLAVFCGTIRDENEGRRVTALAYEAHVSLAEKRLRELEEEARERFEIRRCRIQHRVGRLEVGETSVAVVVRAPHRDAALAAARWAIDEAKSRLPVWKREEYADGGERYLEGRPLRAEDGRAGETPPGAATDTGKSGREPAE